MKMIRMMCMVLALIFVAYLRAQAQSSDMFQATKRTVLAGKSLADQGYRFLEDGVLLGTLLKPSQSAQETFLLTEGKKYTFLAAGDNDAKEVELNLYDDKSHCVKSDKSTKTYAVVSVTPTRTQRYRIILKLNASRDVSSFCSLSVMTNDAQHGYTMRTQSLLDVLTKLEASFKGLSKELEKKDIHLEFHSGQNTWLLMGAILKAKQSLTSDPKLFPSEAYIGVLVGEASCSDANVYVLNRDGKRIEKGTDDTNFSFVAFEGNSSDPLSIEMENAYSSRPSFLVCAILRADKKEAANEK